MFPGRNLDGSLSRGPGRGSALHFDQWTKARRAREVPRVHRPINLFPSRRARFQRDATSRARARRNRVYGPVKVNSLKEPALETGNLGGSGRSCAEILINTGPRLEQCSGLFFRLVCVDVLSIERCPRRRGALFVLAAGGEGNVGSQRLD